MKKSILLTVLLTILLMVSVSAEVPQLVNYQGLLTDAGGAPVADANYLVKFIIYDAPVGGTEKWNSGFQNVATTDGLFSYALGSNVPLPDDIFTDTLRYVGITVGVDPEISPRTRLETSAYAYHALRADTALYSESSVGVTQSFWEGNNIFTGFLNSMKSDSINCPSDGYVMVNLSVVMNCSHTNGDDDVVFVLLVDSNYTITQDQDNRAWALPPSLPTGSYSTFIGIHNVFPVQAGWNEFNVLGAQNSGGGTDNFASSDITLSLLFIPQTFGDVEVGVPSPPKSLLNSLPLRKK